MANTVAKTSPAGAPAPGTAPEGASLDALLNRIRTDAVEKGRSEAEALVLDAQAQADAIRAAAQEEAEAMRRQAREDAERWQAQAEHALRHAARDLLLTLRAGIQEIFGHSVDSAVEETITQDILVRMLEKVTASCVGKPRDAALEIILSPKDKEALAGFFLKKFREELVQGVEIKSDSDILQGFKLSSRDGHMYIDFTSHAIAQSLTSLIRPALAEHLAAAAKGITDEEG